MDKIMKSKYATKIKPLLYRSVTIEWDDKEGYTCGWLLSEFIRKTDESMNTLTSLAVRSRNGQYTTLDYYLTQVEKPLNLIQHDEQLEAF